MGMLRTQLVLPTLLQPRTPNPEMVLPDFKVGLPLSVKAVNVPSSQPELAKHTLRLSSLVIVGFVKLTF